MHRRRVLTGTRSHHPLPHLGFPRDLRLSAVAKRAEGSRPSKEQLCSATWIHPLTRTPRGGSLLGTPKPQQLHARRRLARRAYATTAASRAQLRPPLDGMQPRPSMECNLAHPTSIGLPPGALAPAGSTSSRNAVCCGCPSNEPLLRRAPPSRRLDGQLSTRGCHR
jgi:hypothetical protein